MDQSNKSGKRITLGLILSWVIGSLSMIAGITALFEPASFQAGLMFLAIAAILLPPIRDYTHEKTQMTLSGGLRFIAVLVLLGVAGYTLPNSPASGNSLASGVTMNSLAHMSGEDIKVDNFKIGRGEFGVRVITGEASNPTNRTFSYAQIEFNVYDASGAQVGSTIANINNLEPGGKWRFEAPILEDDATQAKLKGVSAF